MQQVTVKPKSRGTWVYLKCDICRRSAHDDETLLVFGGASYASQANTRFVHRSCMEEFLWGDAETVKEFKAERQKQKDQELAEEVERIRLLYLKSA